MKMVLVVLQTKPKPVYYFRIKFHHTSLQTYHLDSTLKRRGNSRFHVILTWNPRGVFVGVFGIILNVPHLL